MVAEFAQLLAELHAIEQGTACSPGGTGAKSAGDAAAGVGAVAVETKADPGDGGEAAAGKKKDKKKAKKQPKKKKKGKSIEELELMQARFAEK